MARLSGFFLGLVSAANALPYSSPEGHARVKRQVDELRDSYDFVVIGGGTAGLTIADRLTEAFPDRTTLVIEYGIVEKATGSFDPPNSGPGATRLGLSSLPIPAIGGGRASLAVGMTVGGSSVVNGQFFDRGSRHDYDDWARIGSPEFDDAGERWDWDGIFPFFKKSVTFHEPPAEQVDKYGYTWDMEAFGGSTPIHSSFAAYQFPMQKVVWGAFEEMGVHISKECSAGDKMGVCWVPTSQDPMTAERSHAGLGHYADVIESRDNYDLLVAHKALRIVPGESGAAPSVEFRPVDEPDAEPQTVTPKLEVVLSAGAIHTPQILQRSGIGDKAFLEGLGIDVVRDLPGVGYNFQDHCGPRFSFSLSESVSPSQGSLNSNTTFREIALAEYNERPAQGPYTLAMGNSAIYIPLQNITDDWKVITDAIQAQADDKTGLDYLPEGTPDAVKAGYLAQLAQLAQSHAHPEQAVLESPWMSTAPGAGFLLKPLSRGSVMLNPDNLDAEPIVDYRTASNPLDLEVMASFLFFFRRYYATPTLQSMGAAERSPGEEVTDLAEIIEGMRTGITPSFMHPCCTAAMMPEEKGGVVGPDLKVHGMDRLRVADISIMPLIPGTHTSSTAYAIGEKAADIIIKAWSGE